MKITKLETDPCIYSSNVYFVRGNWNAIPDVNGIIDAGADESIIKKIENLNTGVGKRSLDVVVITHSHFDHTKAIGKLKEKYNPIVYSFAKTDFTDVLLKHNDIIKLGDSQFEVIHTPGHSNDSVCLYNFEQKILFSGDTQISIKTVGGSYTEDYVQTIEKLITYDVEVVYPGHGEPIVGNYKKMLEITYDNIIRSNIQIAGDLAG